MPPALIATKLRAPAPPQGGILRPRLAARLSAGAARRLTVVAAPAGFGKTTLLAQWLAAEARPAAWVSLDEGDRDPARLAGYLAAALRGLAPGAGPEAAESPEAALAALVGGAMQLGGPAALVLDDYHAIASSEAAGLVAALAERAPPQLRLVVATREEAGLPLARLRARGQLEELRAADLRFTEEEAADFLARAMGLALTPEAAAGLARRTEGWAAGLQLAALTLRGRGDSALAAESFGGGHRFVLDYVVEEVLAAQDPATAELLLRTSVLDRLCGPLCDALLGMPAGSGQAALERVEAANLFLAPLDDERRWFRYHQLFAEALRQRLAQRPPPGADLAGDHRRAAAWYESAGLEEEALRHAAAAGDHDRAARLAERTWEGMDRRFQSGSWLERARALPDEVVRARPMLSAQFAWALMDAGDVEGSEARLRDAERALAQAGGPAVVPAMVAFARAYGAQSRGDYGAAAAHAARARDLTPPEAALLRQQAGVLLAMSRWGAGDLEGAHATISAWVRGMREAGNLAFALVGVYGLAEIRAAQGRLADGEREVRGALELAARDGRIPQVEAYLLLALAPLLHARGDSAEAGRLLARSAALAARSALPDWRFRWCVAGARLRESEGDWAGALALLDEAARRFVRTPIPELRPLGALRARVLARQGDSGAALAWARGEGLAADDPPAFARELGHTVLARALLADGGARALRDAAGLLARLVADAEAGGRRGSAAEALVLLALAHDARGDGPQALAAVRRAAAIAGPEGATQIFVDEGEPAARLLAALAPSDSSGHAAALLAAFPRRAAGAADLPERLSEREVEVLRLVAQGLSNQAIAERLALAVSTVKGHNQAIFEKLQARRRTEAVARARELGLLG